MNSKIETAIESINDEIAALMRKVNRLKTAMNILREREDGDAESQKAAKAKKANPRYSLPATREEWLVRAKFREEQIKKYLDLTENGGLSGRLAANQVQMSQASFSGDDSMLARYRKYGIEGLIPKQFRKSETKDQPPISSEPSNPEKQTAP